MSSAFLIQLRSLYHNFLYKSTVAILIYFGIDSHGMAILAKKIVSVRFLIMKIVFIVPASDLRRIPLYRLGGKIYGQSNSITGPLILGSL